MLHLQKRYNIWRVRGRVNGVDIDRSLGVRNRATAEVLADNLEKELLLNRSKESWKTFVENYELHLATADLAEATRTKYRFVLHEKFTPYLDSQGFQYVHQITTDVINGYLFARAKDIHPTKQKPMGQEGIKSDQRILHSILNQAVQRKLLAENPIIYKSLNTRKGQVLPYSFEDTDRMAAVCSGRGRAGRPFDLGALLQVLCNTGFRSSDVSRALKTAIQGDWIQVRTKKNGEPVRVPLWKSTQEALAKWRETWNEAQRESPYLFPTRTGQRMKNLDGMMRRIWRRAGIQGAHMHRFRHTFAVRMLLCGASLPEVAEALGITPAVCDRHYTPFVPEREQRMQKIVAAMERLPGPVPVHVPVPGADQAKKPGRGKEQVA